MRRARWFVVAFAAWLAVAPGQLLAAEPESPAAAHATAAPPATGGEAQADAEFAAGREAMRTSDFESACRHFERSQQLAPAPGTLINLALCEERLARLLAAAHHFSELLEVIPEQDDRRAMASAHLMAVRDRLPKLVVRVPPDAPANGTVELDGRVLAAAELGTALPVDPGAHALVYRIAGRQDAHVQIIAVERRTVEQLLAPGAPAVAPLPPGSRAPAAPPPTLREPVEPAGAPVAAHVMTALGAASLAASAVTGALILDRTRTVDRDCDADGCGPEGLRAARSGKTLDVIGTVTFIAGVAGVGAGVYLYIRHARATAPAGGSDTTVSLVGEF